MFGTRKEQEEQKEAEALRELDSIIESVLADRMEGRSLSSLHASVVTEFVTRDAYFVLDQSVMDTRIEERII